MNEIKIEGLDLVDVTRYISAKRDKFMAMMLAELENTMPKDSRDYKAMRKLILDGMNDYTRSLVRVLFGEIEE
jgi:hypothetical protein